MKKRIYIICNIAVMLSAMIICMYNKAEIKNIQYGNQIQGEQLVILQTQIDQIKDMVRKEPQKALLGEYTISAYCPCEACCGVNTGTTKSGVRAVEGITAAAGSSIPFGTVLEIEGIGRRIVQDRGSGIQGNIIDIYFESHDAALQFIQENGGNSFRVWRVEK